MGNPPERKRRPALFWAAFLLVCLAGYFGGKQALYHPDTPLPPEWNPTVPLDLSHPRSRLTNWKLRLALADPALCLEALNTGASFDRMPDFEVSEQCHIRPRVRLSSAGIASLKPVETRCQTALRLAAWLEHGVQPAAQALLGTDVTGVRHASSYNCREIRTIGGSGGRMSTHATASAIDVTGFTLADGRRIDLISVWGDGAAGQFLRQARDSSCDWFGTVLGPDYNRLHADHFHLQNRGWGTCR